MRKALVHGFHGESRIDEKFINNLWHADDTVVLATSQAESQEFKH